MGALGIVLLVTAIIAAVSLLSLAIVNWEAVVFIIAVIMLYKWLTNETEKKGKKDKKKDKEEDDAE